MKKIYLLVSLWLTFFTTAQTPGDVAQTFGSFPGFIGAVRAIAVQTDGKILVGGDFTSFNGGTENRIIRLNADGSKDASFNSGTGFNNTVRAIAVQSDGKILVGGNFTSFNGGTENYIIRLNADGSKDTSFNSGTGFNFTVLAIALQTDGKIFVGGDFTSFNGGTENRIIRLNTDGTKDTSFNSGTGFNNAVRAIAVQTDGKILVGGNFTSFNGGTENRIIRLNAVGTKDTTFNSGTGFNITVWAIAVQTDGKILVGGSFNQYNGGTENGIIRLNTDGTKDTSFNSGTGFDFTVLAIAVQTDGKILLGGDFTSYKGVTENRIIRLNADGSKDTSFNTGTGFSGAVQAITTQSDGKIIVGGDFTTYQGKTENRITRLNADGSKDTSFNTGTGFNSAVYAITTQSDGKIIVGGNFTTYQGITENRIIRLNVDGSKDTSFNTGTGFNSIGGIVFDITIQSDGKIIVGGLFTTYQGITENYIIRLNADGSKDTSFNTGTGFNSNVYDITAQSDGKILVVGNFTTYQGVTENYIIRLNADGSKDTSFNTGTGFDNFIRAITTQNDGKIIVGGAFTTYQGVTENYIIRLNADGSKDTSFNTGTGFNNLVLGITMKSDGKILVGGNFTSYQATTENRIICLNTNGSKDTSFNTGTGFNNFVRPITIKSDGKIIVGGGFITYKGSNASAYLIGLHSEQSLGTPSFTDSNALIMYPNPVKDVLNFQSNNFTTIKAVKIYDLQGKLILEGANETINVNHLTNGLYLAKITTEEGEITKKFIKE